MLVQNNSCGIALKKTKEKVGAQAAKTLSSSLALEIDEKRMTQAEASEQERAIKRELGELPEAERAL